MGSKLSKLYDNYWTKVYLPDNIKAIYYKVKNRKKRFRFKGKYCKYFYHWYNTTWENERSIEIPLIQPYLHKVKESEILEIGNVLPNYFKMNHQVVDKYEKSRGVVNQDVVDFKTSEKFNLIVSISTLEHVGWDETPQDPEKIFTALDLLKSLLKPGGKLVVTIPVGQNPYLDSYIKNGQVKFTEEYHLLRVSEDNDWHEIDDFAGSEYGSPYPHANELYLGIYIK